MDFIAKVKTKTVRVSVILNGHYLQYCNKHCNNGY